MTNTESLLDVITVLVEELGTELELKDDEGLALLAGTQTLAVFERGAEALRKNGREAPPIEDSLLGNVKRARKAYDAERRSRMH